MTAQYHRASLIEAVRTVATGGLAFRDLDRRALAEIAQHLPAEDHAILAMRLAATPSREISDTLRIDAGALRKRLTAMIARLRTGTTVALSAPAQRAPGWQAPGARS